MPEVTVDQLRSLIEAFRVGSSLYRYFANKLCDTECPVVHFSQKHVVSFVAMFLRCFFVNHGAGIDGSLRFAQVPMLSFNDCVILFKNFTTIDVTQNITWEVVLQTHRAAVDVDVSDTDSDASSHSDS